VGPALPPDPGCCRKTKKRSGSYFARAAVGWGRARVVAEQTIGLCFARGETAELEEKEVGARPFPRGAFLAREVKGAGAVSFEDEQGRPAACGQLGRQPSFGQARGAECATARGIMSGRSLVPPDVGKRPRSPRSQGRGRRPGRAAVSQESRGGSVGRTASGDSARKTRRRHCRALARRRSAPGAVHRSAERTIYFVFREIQTPGTRGPGGTS